MTPTESNPYPQIKAYERREFDRLSAYLEGLDADGWVQQSYCSDWLVYQVVSHIGSGARIGALRLKAWVGEGAPVTREVMQEVWGHFDSLKPDQMLASYAAARDEYLDAESSTADEAGLQEVDGFAGRRPMYAYQVGRVWELACHSWDVYVARDLRRTLDPDAVALLAANLHLVNLPLDRDRGSSLTSRPVVFRLTGSGLAYTIDPAAERPRAQPGPTAGAGLVVEGPDEEIVRFASGRHFVPGSYSKLRATSGTAGDLANLRRAFR